MKNNNTMEERFYKHFNGIPSEESLLLFIKSEIALAEQSLVGRVREDILAMKEKGAKDKELVTREQSYNKCIDDILRFVPSLSTTSDGDNQ